MQVEVKVPQLSESVSEATLVAWRKKAGEAVKRDENLIDVETDKVVLELPAPADGVLARIVKNDGDSVTSGEVIAVIDTEGKVTAPRRPRRRRKPQRTPPPAQDKRARTRRRASPAAKKIAAEKGVDTAAVQGTGRDGRVTKGERWRRGAAPAPLARKPAPAGSIPPARAPSSACR
jgi:2-oxoglutarate dehydrogenase E2 component (dihydrolipoamide succinyltransferase)